MPQSRLIVIGLSLQRPRLSPRPVHMGFVVDKGYWDRFISED